LGGYFAQKAPATLKITPLRETGRFAPLRFRFAIAIGVRKGDTHLRDQLDAVIDREQSTIGNILRAYGVPIVGLKGDSHG
jgi:hypothetical protein